jgi:hypothetical protein
MLTLLFISGPLALLIDIWTISINSDAWRLKLKFGPGARVAAILTVDCVQKALFKFVEVLPGVKIL